MLIRIVVIAIVVAISFHGSAERLTAKELKLRRTRQATQSNVKRAQYESILGEPIEITEPSHSGQIISPIPDTSRFDNHYHSGTAYPGPFGWCAKPIAWWFSACRPVEALGTSLRAAMNTQIANGQAGRLVLHQYDFQNDPRKDMSRLSAAGQRRLRRIGPLLQSTGFPLAVEAVPGRSALSEARRLHVLEQVSEISNTDVSDDRVVLREVTAPIHGDEAQEFHRVMSRLLNESGSQGNQSGSSQQTTGSLGVGSGIGTGR